MAIAGAGELDAARSRSAGIAAIVAAGAWLSWAMLNALTHGALDGPRVGANAPWGWLGASLLAASTTLVIPAALVLAQQLQVLAPRVVLAATAAGVLSLALWATAVLTGWWPPVLEPTYVALSALWWCGIAGPLRRVSPRLGVLTFALGVAAAGDAVVTGGYGRLPEWTFPVFGGAKLPLQLVWTASVGIVLARANRHALMAASSERIRVARSG
jgi:hypothetical protein